MEALVTCKYKHDLPHALVIKIQNFSNKEFPRMLYSILRTMMVVMVVILFPTTFRLHSSCEQRYLVCSKSIIGKVKGTVTYQHSRKNNQQILANVSSIE